MKIELTINEINTLLQSLGNMPYAQVFELVDKIRTQAQSQMQAAEQTNG